jgi:multicomponent Na+:H+ antiporter subunit F
MTTLMLLPLAVMDAPLALSIGMVGVALFLGFWRLVVGPSLADRIVALDLMGVLSVAFIALFAIGVDLPVLLDAAMVVALVAFLATVAFARWYLERTSAP